MSGGWVAGGVRAHALLRRRLGVGGARALAAQPSLDAAIGVLAEGPYGFGVRPGMSLTDAEHGIGSTLLWQLRVLAGWQPPTGAEVVRVLAGWFEIDNVLEHVRELTGGGPFEPFRLGALATAWSRLATTRTLGELRSALVESRWGDPGAATPAGIAVGLQTAWARRIAATIPEASSWAVSGLALLVAKERFLAGRALFPVVVRQAAGLLGTGPLDSTTLSAYTERLTTEARWALVGIESPTRLWQAEARWSARLERDGFALTRGSGFDRARVVGCVAVLAVDAWRVRGALQLAARGGGALEVFDASA